jgi:hypothetical protein
MENNKSQEQNSSAFAFLSEDRYTNNKELDQLYKENSNKIKKGLKNVAVYNLFLCFGLYYYARNVVYFRNKYFGNKEMTNWRILRKTLMFTFIPMILLIPNVFLLLGLHPIKHFREKRDIENQMMSSSELRDSIFGLAEMYKENIESTLSEEEPEEKK